MKRWFVGGGIAGAVVAALLTTLLMTGVFAQGPAQVGITAEEAKAAVLATNAGAQVVSVDQDKEDGTSVYEVTLDNGLEVQVDASSGAILGTDQEESGPDLDNVQEQVGAQDQDDGQDEAGDLDQDNVQEEFESQADDANEVPGVEDAPGQ